MDNFPLILKYRDSGFLLLDNLFNTPEHGKVNREIAFDGIRLGVR